MAGVAKVGLGVVPGFGVSVDVVAGGVALGLLVVVSGIFDSGIGAPFNALRD